jgi:glycosyltransferase involved in cell wall biosynthesis
MKTLVISAINFTEAGPLTILRDALDSAVSCLDEKWDIIALVNDERIVSGDRIRAIGFPRAKKAWLLRLFYEEYKFFRLSMELRADLWLSLHDITPRVRARRQAVYCHNPAPFYRLSIREAFEEPRFLLFNLFYAWLYSIRIRRNRFVIVQQEWLRREFQRRFHVKDVIVAHPNARIEKLKSIIDDHDPCVFIYPAFPRIFKNFEVLGEATRILHSRGFSGFRVLLTISGDETRYARRIHQRYSRTEEIEFIGRLDKETLFQQYARCTAVVFPSKLETWGLPIGEGIAFEKKLIVADLPYAHETAGDYRDISFFDPNDAGALADRMQAVMDGTWRPDTPVYRRPDAPFAEGWEELWRILAQDE